ncbi:putative F-box protein At1g47730 [Impatiens glandulifera]|uniref:putative F-box protein At1g47730 n=1 Tax=Impatiens glandulifera TaxID=253017 RepID=UPI001FB13096|nr:putative F-box protein At1g47730 [Impatiens glandulifera]XP_047315406.1 putative F-box protein At1g47730 [Impatiens glandulifera]XP_047315407.1 putative F-box protein At1g47730 [Impatiens glandulifera]
MGDMLTPSAHVMKRSLSEVNEDSMVEIFSRLSAKDISISKCVCKKWNGVMSHNLFICRYVQKPVSISGLYFQQHEELPDFRELPVIYIPLEIENPQMEETVLDFLPEKVSLMSSSNGLLCCRSFVSTFIRNVPNGRFEGIHCPVKNPKIYICNPVNKEFTVVNPTEAGTGINIGLNFDPINGGFQLVTVNCNQQMTFPPWKFSASVFSSKTWSWKVLGAVFDWNSRIHRNKTVCVKGVFYWLTTNHHVITFDMEKEVFGVVKLPGPAMEGEGFHGVCLGSSEECLVYVVVHPLEIRVWVLKNDGKEWFMENRLNLIHFYERNKEMLSPHLLDMFLEYKLNDETQTTAAVLPLAFREGVLYMDLHWFMYSYEFKTGSLKKHFYTHDMKCEIFHSASVVPYGLNLAAMGFLKGDWTE